ncbi:hypothetical protein B0H10DRAFT_943664 [Mycena sp. CBHHK59/15]|nr:hypothetical protein B0H10DRAFT_943664 [Mycena sp. CBHHK59/15]
MKITVNGKSAVATCVDECMTCPSWGALDMTKGLFKFFSGAMTTMTTVETMAMMTMRPPRRRRPPPRTRRRLLPTKSLRPQKRRPSLRPTLPRRHLRPSRPRRLPSNHHPPRSLPPPRPLPLPRPLPQSFPLPSRSQLFRLPLGASPMQVRPLIRATATVLNRSLVQLALGATPVTLHRSASTSSLRLLLLWLSLRFRPFKGPDLPSGHPTLLATLQARKGRLDYSPFIHPPLFIRSWLPLVRQLSIIPRPIQFSSHCYYGQYVTTVRIPGDG